MYVEGIFVYTCLIALRISLCSFFLRITIIQWQRRCLYVVAIVTTTINTLNLFRVNIFYCYPVANYWNVDPDFDGGTCLTAYAENSLLCAQYAISVAADLTTSFLPLLLLKDSRLDKRLKFITCSLLSLGIIASGASIAAIVLTTSYNDGSDYYYTSVPIFLAQVAEPFLGITASSFATYRPLLRSLSTTLHESISERKGPNRKHGLDIVEGDKNSGTSGTSGQFSSI